MSATEEKTEVAAAPAPAPAPAPKAEMKPVEDNGLGLGNFLNDLTPKVEDKPADAKVEKKAEADDPILKTDKSADKPAAETKPDHWEKRYKDTQKFIDAERAKNKELERQLKELSSKSDRIEQKLDGTYKEPDPPSAAAQVEDAEKRGLIVASHHAAVELHGEEYVQATVWADDSPYQALVKQDPSILARVMASKAPVLAAIKEVKKAEASLKYGHDPEEIRKKILAEETDKITKEVLAKFATPPGTPVKGLGEVRGTERTELKSGPPAEVDFKRIFHIGGYAS